MNPASTMDEVSSYLIQTGRSRSKKTIHYAPNFPKLERYEKSQLPRFLFRTYSTSSQGTNTSTSFISSRQKRAVQPEISLSLSSYTSGQLALDLPRHLTFHKFDSPFISLTNSLLLCMLWAYRQNRKEWRGIQVAIVDTSLVTGTIIPAELLRQTVTKMQGGRKDCLEWGGYDDEYLGYGSLYGTFTNLPYLSIRDGLRWFIPELRSIDTTVALRFQIDHLRRLVWDKAVNLSKSDFTSKIEGPMVRLAKSLCGTKHGLFLPMLISVLSLRRFDSKDDDKVKKMVRDASGDSLLPHLVAFSKTLPSKEGSFLNVRAFHQPDWVHRLPSDAKPQALRILAGVCNELETTQEQDIRQETRHGTKRLVCAEFLNAISKLENATKKASETHKSSPDALQWYRVLSELKLAGEKIYSYRLRDLLSEHGQIEMSELVKDAERMTRAMQGSTHKPPFRHRSLSLTTASTPSDSADDPPTPDLPNLKKDNFVCEEPKRNSSFVVRVGDQMPVLAELDHLAPTIARAGLEIRGESADPCGTSGETVILNRIERKRSKPMDDQCDDAMEVPKKRRFDVIV